jgi:phosphoribosyl 1,2-cyclic phosphodiesterase
MLENGRYPYHLKARIRGLNGHLSNKQAFELFSGNGTHMSHLLLAHLSRDNNDPRLVVELFNQIKCNTKITVASRDQESEIYHISDSDVPARRLNLETIQFSLF